MAALCLPMHFEQLIVGSHRCSYLSQEEVYTLPNEYTANGENVTFPSDDLPVAAAAPGIDRRCQDVGGVRHTQVEEGEEEEWDAVER
ncbi:hypothetical protein EV426DRAFT_707702 [Tirmania nivea]|nr:hypothetical protein EV426DRAFT_707702 [Tirmania nivea]